MANVLGKYSFLDTPDVNGDLLLVEVNPIATGTGSLTLPKGTTAQRPGVPAAGMIRFNTTLNTTETYDGTSWSSGSSVFGTEVQYAESNGQSSTSSSSFQQKLSLTTTSLPAGTYRIGYSVSIRNSSSSGGEWRCELDGTSLLVTGTIDSSTPGMQAAAGFWHGSITAGTHDIDIDYRALSGTTFIAYAHIEIFRVS